MTVWGKIAVRNLVKNGRRSLSTILAIGLGCAAINVFGGFTAYIFRSLQDGNIYVLGHGHLTIFKQGFLSAGQVDPGRYLLDPEELGAIKAFLDDLPEVALSTPQLSISGLASNGETSTIFTAVGSVPSDSERIAQDSNNVFREAAFFKGEPLQDDRPYGVSVSTGLAGLLQLTLRSNVIAMASTIEGQINALDAEVLQLFEPPIEPLSDTFMLVPLAFAQSLYDTTAVDRVSVLLTDTDRTEEVRDIVSRSLSQRGMDVEVKTWKELSFAYIEVKQMFDVIFFLGFVIVSIIAAMSIVNTISMALLERTREIGTLRALGVNRRGIVKLFAFESAALGICGAMLGTGLTFATWFTINLLQPTWIPPMVMRRMPLTIYLVPQYMLLSAAALVLLAVLSALLPARRSARMAITEALRHV